MPKLLTLLLVIMAMGAGLGPARLGWAGEEGEAPAKSGGEEAKKPPAGEPAGEEKKEEGGAKKGASQDITGGRFAGDPIYIHLAPMILPIISNEGAEQIVTFQIDIEVMEFDQAERIQTIMPRVMDALMQALYGGLGQGGLRNGKLVNVVKVKAKATEALSQLLGPDVIKDVLIQGVSQRTF